MSTKEEGGLNRALIGKEYVGDAVTVLAEEVTAYAYATNDPNPWYVDQGRPEGIVGPPLFAMRLASGVMFPCFFDPELHLDLAMTVHSEQDMTFTGLLRPGDEVVPRATITAMEDKSTGQILSVTQEYICRGEAVARALSSFFVRSRQAPRRSRAEEVALERSVLFTDIMPVTPDQPIRYGHASGDINPIHMDDEAAKAAKLPGKILQGLCTMAFCSRAVIQRVLGGDPRGLRRLKVRFAHYVLPGDTITISGWRGGSGGALGLEAHNQRGERVISEGLAEVSAPEFP